MRPGQKENLDTQNFYPPSHQQPTIDKPSEEVSPLLSHNHFLRLIGHLSGLPSVTSPTTQGDDGLATLQRKAGLQQCENPPVQAFGLGMPKQTMGSGPSGLPSSTVQIKLLPYDRYRVEQSDTKFLYVNVDDLDEDEFGVPTILLSRVLPLASVFESPLKRMSLQLKPSTY